MGELLVVAFALAVRMLVLLAEMSAAALAALQGVAAGELAELKEGYMDFGSAQLIWKMDNGGGYLDIASELATMIAGTQRTAGRVFERLSFNDRNPFALTLAQRTTPFHAVSQGFSGASGVALPPPPPQLTRHRGRPHPLQSLTAPT